ncbi:hypothetical protein D3C87_1805830 [compost metagenome]
MLKGIPLNKSASTPPIADSGTAVKMRMVWVKDLNVKYSRPRMSSMATGTATESLLLASLRFWNCPP